MNHIPNQNKEQIFFPSDAAEVQDLVQEALNNKWNLRVKASGHAWPPGIASGRAEDEEGFDKDPNDLYQVPTKDTHQLNLRLDKINHVEKMTEDEAEELGIAWTHTWKQLGNKTVSGGLFRVGAGTVLGTNKIDGGDVKIEDGVLYNMDKDGYALFDIGGIYSQAMAGYLATGAAGGSTTESIELNVIAYRIVTCSEVDAATGEVKAITKLIRKEGKGVTEEEKDEFHAYATSMGLLGVTVEVIVRGIPRFAIAGYEITTKRKDCEVDLFGDGGQPYEFQYNKNGNSYTIRGEQKSMAEYLNQNKYTRLEWWPEKNVDAVTIWKAAKIESIPNQASSYPQEKAPSGITIDVPQQVSFPGAENKLTYPKPYINGFLYSADIPILDNPGPGKGEVTVIEVLSSILLMIIGNLNNLSRVSFKIFSAQDGLYGESWIEEFRNQAFNIFKIAIGDSIIVDELLALTSELALVIVRGLSVALAPIINKIGDLLKKVETRVVTGLYNTFAAQVSKDGGPQQFCDIWFEGLPMDKDVNYTIIPVVFTELWFPIDRCTEVMKIIEQVFSPVDNENQTLFAIEFYAGTASKSWLSASGPYPEGSIYNQKDEGETEQGPNVLRVDPYYFPYNSEEGVNNPNDMVSNGTVFFSKKWELIKELCAKQIDAATGNLSPIPFKFHMGKYSGDIGSEDQYKNQYGKWDAWHKKRAEMDPNFVFTNEYWSKKLSIENREADKSDGGCKNCFSCFW